MIKFVLAAILCFVCTAILATPIDPNADTIKLLEPNFTSSASGKTVLEALRNRKSTREYADVELSLEEMSTILWAGSGVNRQDGKRTSPSALALNPVTVYAFTKNAIYKYNPVEQTLIKVVSGDHRRLAGKQDFVATAPVNFVYVADITVYDKFNMPREARVAMATADAAGIAENINIYVASVDMISITRGGTEWAELSKLLKLTDAKYICALAQSVGKK